ncbi:MAG: glycosyltransferase family 2 protein [Bacteroidetes bacterium]|nr:glycosyltransferase family 2 protein [Bacteroidota bacterium]
MKLSAAIITLNEELNLKRTLPTIKDLVDEIVIVDSGSTDKTKEIAEGFNANFIFNQWQGYGEQRNFAFANCSGDWILCIDADEPISPELSNKIKEIVNGKDISSKVFSINRRGVCFGKKLKYGIFFNDYQVRLFRKDVGMFNNNSVHEKFITEHKIEKLPNKYFISHYAYNSMEDYLERFNKYTTLGAIDCKIRNKNSSVFRIVFSPFFTFFKMYFLKLGFLDGLEGFVLSVMSAIYPMIKYFKLREEQQIAVSSKTI